MFRILSEKTIKENLLNYQIENTEQILSASKTQISKKSVIEIICSRFKKFFQAYVMTYKKQQNKVGTLFQTPLKKALVENTEFFKSLVYYIHVNSKLHGITKDFVNYVGVLFLEL